MPVKRQSFEVVVREAEGSGISTYEVIRDHWKLTLN